MTANRRRKFRSTISIVVACLFLMQVTAASAGAYALGTTVADMRQARVAFGRNLLPATHALRCFHAGHDQPAVEHVARDQSRHDPDGGPDPGRATQ